MWEKEIVCGCCLDHQVVKPNLCLALCLGLYPSSCEVIVLLDWSLPQGGGCGCKERNWVLLVGVLCGLTSELEILYVSKAGM